MPVEAALGHAERLRQDLNPDGFPRLVQSLASGDDPARDAATRAARGLWAIRWKIGQLLG
jgi:hypothetical protein